MTYVYEKLSVSRMTSILASDDYASWKGQYMACEALAQWLEDLCEDTGEPMEFDPVALRCDFTLSSLEEFQAEYGEEYKSLDDIRDATSVIEVDSESFIYQAF